MDSAAVESLLQFNQTQTASLHKAVQVNTGTAPSTYRTLIDLFQSDACVKAFTGVEDMRLLMTIADAVAEVDNLNAERSAFERVTIVLARLKTLMSFRCLATLFSVSEATVHRYFYGPIRPLAAVLEAAIPCMAKQGRSATESASMLCSIQGCQNRA